MGRSERVEWELTQARPPVEGSGPGHQEMAPTRAGVCS